LSETGKFHIKVLTRNATSSSAAEVAALPNVTVIEGQTFHEPTLFAAFKGVTHAFVNTNGFAIGEAAEIYWGIRIYEIAIFSGVKHYVWGSLEYSSKLGSFNPDFRCGHLDGKGKVAGFLKNQPTENMAWTLLQSVPYMDTLSERLGPKVEGDEDGEGSTYVFALPLGKAAIPLIDLNDLGKYARWVFENPELSKGMRLKVSTTHVTGADLASTFTKVTGKKAVYKDVTLDQYFAGGVFLDPEKKVGHSAVPNDTFMTYRENFSGFWTLWKSGLSKTNYELLDEILPERIKTLEQWMKKTGYSGERRSVLKDSKDSMGSK
jgi:uncharacterized protein YbjT (DUF2867 family)